MATLLDMPVDILGAIGRYLSAADHRSLARASRGLRRAAVSLWPDEFVVSLKRIVVRAMAVDDAFCARVRATLLEGPLAPLPIHLVIEDCCASKTNRRTQMGTAAEGFTLFCVCSMCGAREPFAPPPASTYDLSYASDFHRVDVVGGVSPRSLDALRNVSTLVLVGCVVPDLSCLAEFASLRKLALSHCRNVVNLPHIRSLQRAEIRYCRTLASLDALAHVRAVALEGSMRVRNFDVLSNVHDVSIERRDGITHVHALFFGRVHTLTLDRVSVLSLPEGGRVHSLVLSSVRVGVRESDAATLDLSRVRVKSLSVRNADGRFKLGGLDVLATGMFRARLPLAYCRDMSWARHLTAVVVDAGEPDPSGRGRINLSALVDVPYVTVLGSVSASCFGLLPAVAMAMKAAPSDVRVQQWGCAALVGGRWRLGTNNERLKDARLATAILGALTAFGDDDGLVGDGCKSLGMMMWDAEMLRIPGVVATVRACLAREGMSAACTAAVLALCHRVISMHGCCGPSQGNAHAHEFCDTLPVDEAMEAATRATCVWPDRVAVLEPAVELYVCAAKWYRPTRRSRVNGVSKASSTTRIDHGWILPAIRSALSLARLTSPAKQSTDLFATLADIDRTCATMLVNAGVVEFLLDSAAAAVAGPISSSSGTDWLGPLGKLAQYACESESGRSLVPTELMFDVARRVSRWGVDGGRAVRDFTIAKLLLAGCASCTDGRKYTEAFRQAILRHRLDAESATAAALACEALGWQDSMVRDLVPEALIASAMHLVLRPFSDMQEFSSRLGCAGGGCAFVSAVVRAAFCKGWLRYADMEQWRTAAFHCPYDRSRNHLNNSSLTASLYERAAANDDGGRVDALEVALWDCVACIETSRDGGIERGAAALLRKKCRAHYEPVSPTVACALAVLELGSFSQPEPPFSSFPEQRRLALRTIDNVVSSLVAMGVSDVIRTSGELLARVIVAAAFVCDEDELGCGDAGTAPITLDARARLCDGVAHALLVAVVRGGLRSAKWETGDNALVLGATVVFALCALDGPSRDAVVAVEDIPHVMSVLRRLLLENEAYVSGEKRRPPRVVEVNETVPKPLVPVSESVWGAAVAALDELERELSGNVLWG